MTEITERDLTFRFPDGCQAVKYDARSDDWSFYRRSEFQHVAGGSKAVDILCVEGNTSWLIEIKDYRRCSPQEPLPTPSELARIVAMKVRDTLAGLAAAVKEANNNEVNERRLVQQALATSQWRVVLHLEQPPTGERLQPEAIYRSSLLQELRSRKLKAIDREPILCDQHTIGHHHDIPWTVFDNAEQHPAVT